MNSDTENHAQTPAIPEPGTVVLCQDPVIHLVQEFKFLPPVNAPQLFQTGRITGKALLRQGQITRVLVETYETTTTGSGHLPELSMTQLEQLLCGVAPTRVAGQEKKADMATALEFARATQAKLKAAAETRKELSTPSGLLGRWSNEPAQELRTGAGHAVKLSGEQIRQAIDEDEAKADAALQEHANFLARKIAQLHPSERERELAGLDRPNAQLRAMVEERLPLYVKDTPTPLTVQERAYKLALQLLRTDDVAARDHTIKELRHTDPAFFALVNTRLEMLRKAAYPQRTADHRIVSMLAPAEPAGHPLLISFEGIDGSGKSTQVRALQQRLLAAGYRCEVLREPGGTGLGEKIRSLLLTKSDDKMHAEAELLLFAASRAQIVRERIRPLLDAGTIVIMDRFIDSTVAYQGFGRGLDLDFLHKLNAYATDGLLPGRTILLEIDVASARARRKGQEADRMEAEADTFLSKVVDGFTAQARVHKSRIRVAVATSQQHVLADRIWQSFQDLVPQWLDCVVEAATGLQGTQTVVVPAPISEELPSALKDGAAGMVIAGPRFLSQELPSGKVEAAAAEENCCGVTTDAKGRLAFMAGRQMGKSATQQELLKQQMEDPAFAAKWLESRASEQSVPCHLGGTAQGNITMPTQARAYEKVEGALVELQRSAQSGPDPFDAVKKALRMTLCAWPRRDTGIKHTPDEALSKVVQAGVEAGSDVVREYNIDLRQVMKDNELRDEASEPRVVAMGGDARGANRGGDAYPAPELSLVSRDYRVLWIPAEDLTRQILAAWLPKAAAEFLRVTKLEATHLVASGADYDKALNYFRPTGEDTPEMWRVFGLEVIAVNVPGAPEKAYLNIPAQDAGLLLAARVGPQAWVVQSNPPNVHVVQPLKLFASPDFTPDYADMAQVVRELHAVVQREMSQARIPEAHVQVSLPAKLKVAFEMLPERELVNLAGSQLAPDAWKHLYGMEIIDWGAGDKIFFYALPPYTNKETEDAAIPGHPPAEDICLLRHPCDKILETTICVIRSWLFDNVVRPAESIKNIPQTALYVRMPSALWDMLRKEFSYNRYARAAFGPEFVDALENNRHWSELFGYRIKDWTEKGAVTFWAAPCDIPAAFPIAPVESASL